MRPFRHSLRDRVEIHRRVVVSDGGGGETGRWDVILTTRAAVVMNDGLRSDPLTVEAGMEVSTPIVQVILRDQPTARTIRPGDRVVQLGWDRTFAVSQAPFPHPGNDRMLAVQVEMSATS